MTPRQVGRILEVGYDAGKVKLVSDVSTEDNFIIRLTFEMRSQRYCRKALHGSTKTAARIVHRAHLSDSIPWSFSCSSLVD